VESREPWVTGIVAGQQRNFVADTRATLPPHLLVRTLRTKPRICNGNLLDQ
jgi:hypothetical protein